MSTNRPWIRVALGAIALFWASGHAPSAVRAVGTRASRNEYAVPGFATRATTQPSDFGLVELGNANIPGAIASSDASEGFEMLSSSRRLRRGASFADGRRAASRASAAVSGDGDPMEALGSPGRGNDSGHDPKNRRGDSVISREDELFRSKHGAAAYNDLLRQRHREEMSVAGMLPDPVQPSTQPNRSETMPSPVTTVTSTPVGNGSGSQGIPSVVVDPTPAVVPGSAGVDPLVTPSGWALPGDVLAPPVLRIVSTKAGRQISVVGPPLSGWTIEHADTLRDPRWQAIGTTRADGTLRLEGSAVDTGFWRVRSAVR